MSAERRSAGAALVNGTALDYETLGEGPAVLLLHGGLGFDRSGFLPAFERLTPPYQVAAYDHRGNGRSGRPPLSTVTMEQLADDAAAIIEALDLGRPVVVGHSYGGFVAQELALRHPHAVAGLVLVDTTPGQPGASDDPEADPGPPPPPEALAPFERPPTTNDEFRRMMRGMLRFHVHRDPAIMERVMARAVIDVDAFARGVEVLDRWSSVDRLHAIAVPTLVLVGRHDPMCAPQQAYRIARRIPGAETVVFEASAHMPWLEEEDEFFGALSDWLRRHPPTAATAATTRHRVPVARGA